MYFEESIGFHIMLDVRCERVKGDLKISGPRSWKVGNGSRWGKLGEISLGKNIINSGLNMLCFKCLCDIPMKMLHRQLDL